MSLKALVGRRPPAGATNPQEIEVLGVSGRVRRGHPQLLPPHGLAVPGPGVRPRLPLDLGIGTLGLINGVGENQMLPGGELAKRVVGGRLPE